MTDFPTEAKYMRVKNYNDKVLARHTTRISPFNGAQFGPNNTDRLLFNIPSETGMEIDMDTMMFHFNASVSVTNNTGGALSYDVAFNNSMESVIQTLRIRKGTSFLLEDIQRYNYLDSMFMNYVSDSYNKSAGTALMGIGNYHQRVSTISNVAAAGTGTSSSRNFCLPFRLSGISQYSGLISTSLIDSVCAFQIEIELAPAKDCLQVNSTTTADPPTIANYILDTCYITYDVVRMVPEYHQQLQASIQRGIPLQIPYKTWRTSMYSLPASAQTLHTFNINDTVKSLNAVYVAFFKQVEQGKFAIPGRDRKHKPTNLKSAQLQLGSFYYPLQPMDCQGRASQAFLELQKALGLAHVRSENAAPFSFVGSQYYEPLNQGNNLTVALTGTTPAGNAVIANDEYTIHGAPVLANRLISDSGAPLVGQILGAATKAAGDAAVQPSAVLNAAHDDFTFAGCSTESLKRYYGAYCQGPNTEFIIGFNLRKVLDAIEGEIVGSDIQSSGSGLMTLRLEFNTPSVGNAIPDTEGPYQIVIASLYDAVLEIQSNQQTFRVE